MRWVAPFGDPGLSGCSLLHRAYRSVPRPSSPLGAKASTRCPCFALAPPQPRAQTAPAGASRPRDRGGQHTHAVNATHRAGPKAERLSVTPAFVTLASSPWKKNGSPGRAAPRRRSTGPGTAAAPSCAPPSRPGPPLVGPGRLERPTSRLSGVRSDQLSYGPGRPEPRKQRSEVRHAVPGMGARV